MRVTLGKAEAGDTPAISVAMMDPRVAGWLHTFPYPYDAGVQRRADGGLSSTADWAVRVDGRFAGIVLAAPELGCWIDPKYQGSGIATRAAMLALSRHFAGGARYAHARYLPENQPMKAMLDRLGFLPDDSIPSSLTRPDLGLLRLTLPRFAEAQPFVLRTSRLRISTIRRGDLPFLYDIAALRDVGPNVTVYRPGMSLADFGSALTPFSGLPPFWCKVRTHDRIIGAIGLESRPVSDLELQTSGVSRLLLHGFLSPSVRGFGIASEVVAAFVQELHDRFAIKSISSEIFADEVAGAKVLQRAGFRPTLQGFTLTTPLRSGPAHRYSLDF